MDQKQDILIEDIGDGITKLILNRSPVNALTPRFLHKVAAALDQIEGEKNIRAVPAMAAMIK